MSNFYKVRSWNAGAWDLEEEYELKKEIAKKYGISFLRLTVEQGILQSVWFDQRSNLKSDMGKLTIAINELKSNNLEHLEVVQGGQNAILDEEERPIYIQHEGSDSSGTIAQCFEHRTGH